MPWQSSLNCQELKVCYQVLRIQTHATVIWVQGSEEPHTVHTMSTVLLVDTRPVKTDSKTRAGVHNDVSNPSVAQQSDRPGGWKEVKSSVSLPK